MRLQCELAISSPIPSRTQFTKLLVPGRSICLPALSSPGTPASLPYPSRPIGDRSSIAAPTTATAFLLVSLSEMPRGSYASCSVWPRRLAPEHFRSRLTTIRQLGMLTNAAVASKKPLTLRNQTALTDFSGRSEKPIAALDVPLLRPRFRGSFQVPTRPSKAEVSPGSAQFFALRTSAKSFATSSDYRKAPAMPTRTSAPARWPRSKSGNDL